MDFKERLKSGRNDACPCGSGKKYKKCHLAEDEAAEAAHFKKLQEEADAAARAQAEADEKAGKKTAAPTDKHHHGTQAGGKFHGNQTTGSKAHIPRRSAV